MIIFIISGQARNSPFSHSKREMKILHSYNKYIFNTKFVKNYDYKVYITTDDIHLQDTIDYFGKNIGNIHLLNTGYYYNNISNKINDVKFYIDKYLNKDFNGCQIYENSIYQHYKILDCYNLYINDNTDRNINNDIIIRMRLDTIFHSDIMDNIILLQDNTLCKILMHWDLFAIGKYLIMKEYCNGLNNNYGNYNYNADLSNIEYPLICHDYKKLDRIRWTYATEVQLFEILFQYCNKLNLNINKTIIPINICNILR
jgi:hypothetical protein